MDKETFDALQEIITFAQRTHCDVHPDAHHKAFQKVFAWMREARKDSNDTIAVLDATSAHLSVFAIPAGMQVEEIEAYLADLGYALNNCEWQIITSMNIDIQHA